MKIWEIRYECSGVGRSGVIHLTAADHLTVCQDFVRFWAGRQDTDKLAGGLPYFGVLFFVGARPWAPWRVSDDGQLYSANVEADGGLEWKIDTAGMSFTEYAEAICKQRGWI